MLSRFAATATIAFVALAAPLHAQVVNGSFDTPAPPSGSYTLYGTGSTFDGWTVVGNPGNVAIISTLFTQGGYSFPAHSGDAWLDLTGNSNSATGVEQAVTTIVGQSYDLSFWVGNLSGDIFGTTSTVNVMVNGSLFMTAVNSTPGTTQTWQQFTKSFIATSGSTTVTFINGDPGNDTENGLDDVSFSRTLDTPTTTPEPASLVLIATGFAALVPLVRKRRS